MSLRNPDDEYSTDPTTASVEAARSSGPAEYAGWSPHPTGHLPTADAVPVVQLTTDQLAQAIQAGQDRARAHELSTEATAAATQGLVTGGLAMAVGAAAGILLFAWLSDAPITQDVSGTITFALLGAGLPIGWHATRQRSSSLSLPLLIWPVALVLRAWFSIVIGLPCAVLYAVRHTWRLARARNVRAALIGT